MVEMYKKFQFHFGTIYSSDRNRWSSKDNQFQFHFGTIYSQRGTVLKPLMLVSIPLWYYL